MRLLVKEKGDAVINVDKLTYAGSRQSVEDIAGHPLYTFEQADIADGPAMRELFRRHQPDAVIHLAAESHVDRSINAPAAFLTTNVLGTFTLLEAAREFWRELPGPRREAFRFLHVSTDEVYGSLTADDAPFTESSRYEPRSPYAASKASADHLVRAWGETYGLPVIVTCSANNYGPWQFPEKLIPMTLLKCLWGQPIPVYGQGEQWRDWLHVRDHANGLAAALHHGRPGETYHLSAGNEQRNLDLVRRLCALMDACMDSPPTGGSASLIEFVADRPGHDFRYAMRGAKARQALRWSPQVEFEEGLRETVRWYLEHEEWWSPILQGQYPLQRLGGRV